MSRSPTAKMAEALAVTIEACGAEMSEAAVRIMLADLAEYAEAAVLDALKRVRREHKGRLSLAAIIERIDDGRPGVEVAWSMVPRDERETAVVTTEMMRALCAAQPLLNDGDEIAARMAFKEAYIRDVEQARAAGESVQWQASVGWDATGRPGPLGEAARLGRIPVAIAEQYVQGDQLAEMLALANVSDHPALAAPKALPKRIAAALPDKRVPVAIEQPAPEPEADRIARIDREKARIRRIIEASETAEAPSADQEQEAANATRA